jgi:6-pyruvoyltetrahydropterin/6-carboxytetrahydropterin synthase
MVVDFDDIKKIVRERVVDVIDHRTLNEFDENPTVERMVLWAWNQLDGVLAGLDELVLWETDDSCAVLRHGDSTPSR